MKTIRIPEFFLRNVSIFSLILFSFLSIGGSSTLANHTFAEKISSFLNIRKDTVENLRSVPKFSIEDYREIPSVRCIVVGDWGTGGKLQQKVAEKIGIKARLEQVQFIISTGDNIYPKGVKSADDEQWKSKFEDVYSTVNLPWYAVLGNHDYRSNPQAQVDYSKRNSLWNMPAFQFRFSQQIDSSAVAEFFMIDTNPILSNKNSAENLAWLERALAQSSARWKIVVGHHPVRSYGHYGDNAILVKRLKPILDRYNVDLYMNGHEHDLQYIKNPDDRFRVVISGGGSGSRSTAFGEHTIFAGTNGGFCFLAIAHSTLHLQFLDKNGTITFADTMKK